MTHPAIALWGSAAESFDRRYQLITQDHQLLATPCSDFDVQALVAHAVGTQIAFAAYFGGSVPADAGWDQAREGMAKALVDPSTLSGTYDHPAFGEIAKEHLLAVATNDLLIHSWDLARAIGVDETLPAENLQPAIDGINRFPAKVRSVLFADPVDAPDGASLQTQMLAIAGRSDS